MKYKLLCDNDKCYFCGLNNCKRKGDKKFRNLIEVHHIKERNDGGDNSPSNLVPVCSNCHSIIHLGQIRIIEWLNYGYCYKLKWVDPQGNENIGSAKK